MRTGLPPALQPFPPELWIYIFLHALPDSYPSLSSGRPETILITDEPLVPLLISSVCHTWRTIACSTPQLWEICWLSYKSPQLNHVWIHRAGPSRGLTLYGLSSRRTTLSWRAISVRGYVNEKEREFNRSILAYRHRWKAIRIDTGPLLEVADPLEWLRSEDVHGEVQWQAPMLESFKVEARFNALNVLTPSWIAPLVAHSPFLKELRLFDLDTLDLSLLPNQLIHLVDLEVLCANIHDLLNIFQNMHSLQKFTGSVSYLHIGAPAPINAHLMHPTLSHLHLRHEWQAEEGTTIMNLLTLPSLQKLHASHASWFGLSFHALHGLLNRSQCHITELVFTDIRMHYSDLISIFQHPAVDPSLAFLELNEAIHITAPLLSNLLYDPQEHNLPRLERLCLSECYLHIDDDIVMNKTGDGLIADLITSRLSLAPASAGGLSKERANLKHVSINYIEPDLHQLDLARMVPLPCAVPQGLPHCVVDLGLLISEQDGTQYKKFLQYNVPCSETRIDMVRWD